MGQSNEEWGQLADDGQRDAWDRYDDIPQPGENIPLDNFLTRKHLDHDALVRIGARMAAPNMLATAFEGGIKYRDVVTDHRRSFLGSTFNSLKIIPGTNDRSTVILCEGETDAARLTMLYSCDVGVMPAGARTWRPTYTTQVSDYGRVLVGLDRDEAGEDGWQLIHKEVPHAVRFAPPTPASDWCELPPGDELALPRVPDRLAALVPARDLLVLTVPEIVSWFDGAVLPVAGSLVLHGGFKGFKSWMALDLMRALATGGAWAGFESAEEQARAAIIQYEVPWPYYRARIEQIRKFMKNGDGEAFDKNFLTYTPTTRPDLKIGNQKSMDKVRKVLVEGEVAIVLIDPIRRALVPGLSMNDEDGAPAHIRAFTESLQAEGITVVLVHHDNLTPERNAGRSDPANMTGSGAWAGDPDTIVTVHRPPLTTREEPRRNLSFLLRNAPSPPPVGFELKEDGSIVWGEAHFESADTEEKPF